MSRHKNLRVTLNLVESICNALGGSIYLGIADVSDSHEIESLYHALCGPRAVSDGPVMAKRPGLVLQKIGFMLNTQEPMGLVHAPLKEYDLDEPGGARFQCNYVAVSGLGQRLNALLAITALYQLAYSKEGRIFAALHDLGYQYATNAEYAEATVQLACREVGEVTPVVVTEPPAQTQYFRVTSFGSRYYHHLGWWPKPVISGLHIGLSVQEPLYYLQSLEYEMGNLGVRFWGTEMFGTSYHLEIPARNPEEESIWVHANNRYSDWG